MSHGRGSASGATFARRQSRSKRNSPLTAIPRGNQTPVWVAFLAFLAWRFSFSVIVGFFLSSLWTS